MTINKPDLINGLVELCGSFFTWMNARRLYKDREVKGVYWPATLFFTSWGLWNLYYYPALNQWCSFTGGAVLVSGNIAWIAMLITFKNKKHDS